MLDLVILPTLRAYYMGPDYEARCDRFATERLKLPKSDQHKVQLPAFISWDSAPVHYYGHQLMLSPRQSDEKVSQLIAEAYERAGRAGAWGTGVVGSVQAPTDFNITDVFPERGAPRQPLGPETTNVTHVAHDLTQRSAGAGGRREAAQLPVRSTSVREVEDARLRRLMQERLARWAIANGGGSWVDLQLRRIGIWLPGMICLLPQQIMPLPRVCPDIHCPVEHLVGTLKHWVTTKIREERYGDSGKLYLGVTYQRWVRQAVAERGNGVSGRHHVSRSVEKQRWVCEILAAEEGAQVRCEFTFADGGENRSGDKREVWFVRGTAGGWIGDYKWT